MVKNLTKRIAILEMYKVKHSSKDNSKSLKVKSMLVWRTIKRFNETKGVNKRHRQGCSRTARIAEVAISTPEKLIRNPKWSLRNLAKEANMLNGTMWNLKTSPYKHQNKTSAICNLCGETTSQIDAKSSSSAVGNSHALCSAMWRNLTFNNILTARTIGFGFEREAVSLGHLLEDKERQLWCCGLLWLRYEKSHLIFVKPGFKLNRESEVKDSLLKSSLLKKKKIFENWRSLFQQDLAAYHVTKTTQDWLVTHVLHLIPKEE